MIDWINAPHTLMYHFEWWHLAVLYVVLSYIVTSWKIRSCVEKWLSSSYCRPSPSQSTSSAGRSSTHSSSWSNSRAGFDGFAVEQGSPMTIDQIHDWIRENLPHRWEFTLTVRAGDSSLEMYDYKTEILLVDEIDALTFERISSIVNDARLMDRMESATHE
jgi:hypothetical protein